MRLHHRTSIRRSHLYAMRKAFYAIVTSLIPTQLPAASLRVVETPTVDSFVASSRQMLQAVALALP